MVGVALVATLLAGPAPAAVPCSSPPSTFPTAQMTPGMTGVGYTVLQGTTIVPFDVEILGVMPNAIFLGVDIVAARITGPASFLGATGGAVGGMSGSPIYINGRLAGAVAWAIAENRQIFGMTAAEDMVGMFNLPGAGQAGAMPARISLTPRIRSAATAADSPLEPGATLEALPVPLGVSGLPGVPLSHIERQFADHGITVQAFRAGAVAAPTASSVDPTRFLPGDGLGVSLSYGDVSYYGFGTATAVCGDVVIGFGHPMFWGIGRVSLGMNEVNVLAIDNGTFFGTKIGTLGDSHGELTQDRFSGVAGVFGQLPTIVPVISDFSSPDTGLSRHGETDVAWDQDYFVADAAFAHAWSNLTYVEQEDAPGTLALGWTISGTREDGTPFTVSNRLMAFNASSAASEAYALSNAMYALAFNRFENIQFTSVDLTGSITEANLTAPIARVRVSSPLEPSVRAREIVRAAPGDVVRVEVTFAPIDGPQTVATFDIRVPRHANGRERIDLAGARGRLNPGRDVRGLEDLIAQLSGGDHRNDLIVSAFGRTTTHPQDVIVHGRDRFWIQVVR